VLLGHDPPDDVQAQPGPPPLGFDVKNGSKIRDSISGGIPVPSSSISTTTRPSS